MLKRPAPKSTPPPFFMRLCALALILLVPLLLLACGSDELTEGPGAGQSTAAASTSERAEPTPRVTARPPLEQTSAETDREVLTVLFNATNGEDWNDNSLWLSDSVETQGLRWKGVHYDRDLRVTSLQLGRNGLGGEIPPELGNLTELRGLDLSGNELSGEIPPELGNLANLTSLGLGENGLSGEIPPELGNLANLEWLSLGSNQL